MKTHYLVAKAVVLLKREQPLIFAQLKKALIQKLVYIQNVDFKVLLGFEVIDVMFAIAYEIQTFLWISLHNSFTTMLV